MDHRTTARSSSPSDNSSAATVSHQAASDLFRSEPHRFIDVGVGEVAYRRVGQGPDVLFIHGIPLSGATFRTLLPYLADHFTCHIIDLPGAGSSRFAENAPLTIASQIAAVRRTVEVLGLNEFAIVGHDAGGLITRHALAGDPRVRAMTLIDTELHRDLGWRFKAFVRGGRLPGFGAALGWASGKRRLRRNTLVFGATVVDRSLLDGEFDEFFLTPLHTSRHLQRACGRLVRSFDNRLIRELEGLHRAIEVPVQLIWGERDHFFPVAQARHMAATFPNARLDVIPNAGLFSHEERPAEVSAALLAFLTTPRT